MGDVFKCAACRKLEGRIPTYVENQKRDWKCAECGSLLSHLWSDTVPIVTTEIGAKDDSGKTRYDLIPPEALEQMVEVLTFGAKKYGSENWRMVSEADTRYFAAAQRHLWAWKRGEESDKETGRSHLAHALCCIMFLLELEKA